MMRNFGPLVTGKKSTRYCAVLLLFGLSFAWNGVQAQSGTSLFNPIRITINNCGITYFQDSENTGSGFSDNYGNPSPDVWYTFTVIQSISIDISLYWSNFDTYLHVLDENGNLVNDDNTFIYQIFEPGKYYIVAEGAGYETGYLNFSLGASNGFASYGASVYEAIDLGIYSNDGNYGDYRYLDYCMGDEMGLPNVDVYHRFTLMDVAEVRLSHCGTEFDTYMYLLDAYGNVIVSNDDSSISPCPGSQAYIHITLPAGDYYVVSEGVDVNYGDIAINISVKMGVTLPPLISYSNPKRIRVNSSVNLSPISSGGIPDSFIISPSLPNGLIFDNLSGSITGTPISVSTFTNYTITAHNLSGSYSTNLSFAITEALVYPAPSLNQNYIISYTSRESGLTNTGIVLTESCDPDIVQADIQYFDGLGRLIQTIQVKGSPENKDIVVPRAYDTFGRETKRYLPYASTSNNGIYNVDGLNKVVNYYVGSPVGQAIGFNTPYSETLFEASPLNRILDQGAPGTAWQIGGGHTVRTDYENNVANEVKSWVVTATGANSTTYAAGRLYKTISHDENWLSGKAGTVEEFKDLQGRVVLKRIWETETVSLSTYYVYDDFGNLNYVLPPKTIVSSFTEADAVFMDHIYGYHYDSRQRLIEKKIPGKGWTYMVYNKLGQLVASQDELMRSKTPQEWQVYKYDAIGRTVLTGIYTYHSSTANANYRAALQETIDAQGPTIKLWESRIATGNGYSTQCWPKTGFTSLVINYYDDYSIPGLPEVSPYNLSSSYSNKTEGLPVVKMVNVLGTGHMLWSVSYYDDEGRVVRNVDQHYQGSATTVNNYDDVIHSYNFLGEVIGSTRRHYINGTEQLNIANTFTYDHQGRAKDIYQKTGDNATSTNAEVLLSRNNYNEIGQLSTKQLHSVNLGASFAQTVTYSYNSRGWLKSQSAALFTQKLNYEDMIAGVSSQYNGNISRQEWGTGKYYNYTYDKLNRVRTALSSDNYNERISYDVMGNIDALKRDSANVLVDQLNYTYAGNQLSVVLDSNTANTNNAFQLPGVTNYLYDGNGNMTGRNNAISTNNLSLITYNYLNLPKTMNVIANSMVGSITYTYDAEGKKLKKLVTGGTSLNNEYIRGIHYEGGSLKFVSTATGKVVRKSSTNYAYEYTLADHLGNGRVYFDVDGNGAARKIQETDYYAFGLDIQRAVNGTENKYQYNGKEKQDQEKMFDYGARFYDPVIGRWNVIDKKAELYFHITPYAYAANTPTNAIDPDGHLVIFINGNYTDGSGGSRSYWQQSHRENIPGEDWRRDVIDQDFAGAVMNRLGDHNARYVDGGGNFFKGNHPLMSLLLPGLSGVGAEDRRGAGYSQGMNEAAAVIESLHRTGGVIDESIKVITHSMGGAYGKGYIQAILDYAKQHEIAGVNVAFEADFAPFQTGQQKAVKGVKTLQYSHDESVAGNDPISGAIQMDTSKDKEQKHSIFSFMSQISTLPAGNYKVVNGKIVPN